MSRKGAGCFQGNAAEISWVGYGLKFQISHFCHGDLSKKSHGEIPVNAGEWPTVPTPAWAALTSWGSPDIPEDTPLGTAS